MHSVFQENYKMASIKVKFRPSIVRDKEGTVYYQIIHERVIRQIRTGFRIFKEEWNVVNASVKHPFPEHRNNYLQTVEAGIRMDIERMYRIISDFMTKSHGFTSDDLVEEFAKRTRDQSFFNFAQGLILRLKSQGNLRTSETYMATLMSFMKFLDGKDIQFDSINADLIEAYEIHLKNKGLCLNTVSFYMRILRAVYNRAVNKGITAQNYPFRDVYTGVEKTVKRAIPLKSIKRIMDLDLSLQPALCLSRDLFLFSFYTRGMSFIDMAFLKKSDLRNGTLSYVRRKTGQRLSIGWEKCMQEIVQWHPSSADSIYLLPIISLGKDERKQYRNASLRINKHLRKIGKMIGLSTHLTMYVARHSWASAAKEKKIPLSVISEGLGHDSEQTTRIYLTSLDIAEINRANNLILKSLQKD